MKGIIVGLIAVVLLTAPHIVNAYRLVGCDFESPYKCEVIHAIGVVLPPAAWVTVWFGDERAN